MGRLNIVNLYGRIPIDVDVRADINTGELKSAKVPVQVSRRQYYALRPEGIVRLVLESRDCNEAAKALIDGSREFKYPDNMSAIVVQDFGR